MSEIQRIGVTKRWSDVVIHNGTAKWVEVPEDAAADSTSQIRQVLAQMDATLTRIGSNRTRVLQVLIFLADLRDVGRLNEAWDDWFPEGHAPVRACMQAGLQANYSIELIIEAALSKQ